MVDNKNEVAQDTPQEEKETEEIQQFIGIQLNNEIYGIPVEKIKTIVKPLQITNIPGTPPHIMGLMNLHGEILCVVDVTTSKNGDGFSCSPATQSPAMCAMSAMQIAPTSLQISLNTLKSIARG